MSTIPDTNFWTSLPEDLRLDILKKHFTGNENLKDLMEIACVKPIFSDLKTLKLTKEEIRKMYDYNPEDPKNPDAVRIWTKTVKGEFPLHLSLDHVRRVLGCKEEDEFYLMSDDDYRPNLGCSLYRGTFDDKNPTLKSAGFKAGEQYNKDV